LWHVHTVGAAKTQTLHTKALQTGFNTQALHTHTLILWLFMVQTVLKKKEEDEWMNEW
jgi:hypothetical protein